MKVKQFYKYIENSFAEIAVDDPAFEAQCIMDYVFGFDRIALITHGSDELSDENIKKVDEIVLRRKKYEPLQYILGKWNFFGFDFEVGEGVLIPRDDTEVVLELCLQYLDTLKKDGVKVVDLCAGSGAISVAIQKISKADVTAVELSDKAYNFLEKNIKLNNAFVTPFKGDVFNCFKEFKDNSIDLIVSNPPYIISSDIADLQAEVKQEPAMALDGGADGYDFYRAIIRDWSSKIKKGGCLAFELGEGQAEYVSNLMINTGFKNIRISTDLGGVQRAIIGTLLN